MDFNHIAMDQNHIELIYGLIISHKPMSVLEIGVGSGFLTKKIIAGFEYNQIKIDIDCVDNFFDWNGNAPRHILNIPNINLINKSEHDFIESCNKQYDLIVSDADHFNCHRWIEETCKLLKPSGFLVYHDVTNKSFPNLLSIKEYFMQLPEQYSSLLFAKNSRNDERCDRGLLITQKR